MKLGKQELAAALVLSLSFIAHLSFIAPARAVDAWAAERYQACTELVEAAPETAMDRAVAWVNEEKTVAARHCLALALVAIGEPAAAAEGLAILAASVAENEPEVASALYAQAGNAAILAEDPTRAVLSFDKALELDPPQEAWIEIYVDRARALAMGGDIWEAIDDLNRVLEVAPDRDDCYAYRAAAYRRVEAYDLAADDAERALTLNPDNIPAMVERGAARLLNGDTAGARSDFERAIAVEPDSPSSILAKKMLATLEEIEKG